MDKICITLLKENLDISKAEVETILKRIENAQEFIYEENLLITSIPDSEALKLKKTLSRLAYAKKAFLIIDKADNPKQLLEKLQTTSFNFQELEKYTKIRTSFKISTEYITKNHKFNIKELAKIVYDKGIEIIDLEHPLLDFCAINAKNSYFCLKFWENTEKYDNRRADKRPAPHPTSMNPRLARAMVNLAAPMIEVLDPFCGSGGILLEAGILGLKPTGIDIDSMMIKRANLNLKHFKIKDYTLTEGDAMSYNKKVECVVTDVPYGKSSKLKEDLQSLTERFLSHFKQLTETIVLACPDNIQIHESGWEIKRKFGVYIHSSLTRNIYVLNKS